MNQNHAELCGSAEWAEYLAAEVVPWALDGLDLTGDVLELGGGYGASTGYLVGRVGRLTVLEIDPGLATGLVARFPSADVRVGDATATGLPDATFDAVVCFTMLHHVSPPTAQDRLFAEVVRVLRPGAWFAGADSLASDRLREFHLDDTYEPIDPAHLPARLRTAGFAQATAEPGERRLRFRAVK
jgi:SAM-dependent methyltransferase